MKTILYYFTGTGNSLADAKKICGGLLKTPMIPELPFFSAAGIPV